MAWILSVRVGTLVTVLLAAGCASFTAPGPGLALSPDVNIRQCAAWYVKLDATVDAASVRDGGEARVAGFPHLRVNRFLASFRTEIDHDSSSAARAWLAAMAALDVDARMAEIANLPASSTTNAAKRALELELLRCGEMLASATRAREVAAVATVADDYSATKRALGLYPLTRLPFFAGVTAWQQRAAHAFTRSATTATVTYVPPAQTHDDANLVFSAAARDGLGVPQLDASQWRALFAAHAPQVEVETTGTYDQMGALAWAANGITLQSTQPAVYQRVSYTRIAGNTHAQLNYSFWFSERPASGHFDLLAGAHDGIIFRVTLDRDGRPLMYDTIHRCGCYQLFFPTTRMRAKRAPEASVEWAFVPRPAPTLAPGMRVALRVQSRTHYIVGINAVATTDGIAYQWRDDRELRVLPHPDGGTKSIFSADGIMRGSERGERWLFWPMGIASPGAMRQWGRHATAFVGRRHFDDADLIDQRFEIIADR